MIPNKNTFKTISAIFIGSILEWYDFGIFIFLMPIFSGQFFTSTTPYLAPLFGYCTLAVSYLIRPLGGAIFGYLGDRVSKKQILVITMLLMSFPSLLIGMLPTYTQIGLFAPLTLISLRIIQGLSAGGEMIGAIILTYENTPSPLQRPLTNLVWVGSGLGMLLGSGTVALLLKWMGSESVAIGGWRIPFIVGGILGFFAFYLRRCLLVNTTSVKAVSYPYSFIQLLEITEQDRKSVV